MGIDLILSVKTEGQRSFSVVLKAAHFESDVESLRAPSLVQPSSSCMSTTSLKPSLREPNTHSKLMISPSGLPP